MPQVGETIGHIRLTETLGEGGMGTVWAGFDDKLRREVAVKTVRADRVDLEARARFLAEARILSRLEHLNICRVHDYIEGEDADYLVLERIRGRTLKAAIAEGLEPAARLRVASGVARALVAAHARGVVHSDLKPSNVMLTEDGEARVLDFGLARPAGAAFAADAGGSFRPGAAEALGGGTLTRLAAVSLSSRGAVAGSPGYMSPEQARGERLTPAGDMYAFGLLLQEIFTGRPAYPADLPRRELVARAAAGDALPTLGVDIDLRKLIQRLLAPLPEARPTAVEAVAALDRVRDRPRRRRRWLAAVAAVLGLTAAGVKYGVDLRRERNQAVAARSEAEQVTSFLVELFDASRPEATDGRELSVRELLDVGEERIAELDGHPAVQGRLLFTFGGVHLGLGDYRRAAEYSERAARTMSAAGSSDKEIADALRRAGQAWLHLGDTAAGRKLCEEALELTDRSPELGELQRSANLYCLAWVLKEEGKLAEAIPYQEEVVAIRRRERPGSGELVAALGFLAVLHVDAQNLDRAGPVLEEALALRVRLSGPDHPHRAKLLGMLARVYRLQGDLPAAEDHARSALEIRERVLGAEHASVAYSYFELAALLLNRGNAESAIEHLERAGEIWRNSFGDDAKHLAAIHEGHAVAHRIRGEHAAAVAEYQRALASRRKHLGDDHPVVARNLTAMAPSQAAIGQGLEAEAGLRRAIEIVEPLSGDSARLILADALVRLAGLLASRGTDGEARALLERAEGLGALASPERPAATQRLAEVHLARGSLAEAAGDPPAAARRYSAAVSLLSPLAPDSGDVDLLEVLARALLAAGRLEEACRWIDRLAATDWRRPELSEACLATESR